MFPVEHCNSQENLWRVKSINSLDLNSLLKVELFFKTHFPNVFDTDKIGEVLKWKIGPDNPAGQGYAHVAVNESDEVIGVATATKRKVISTPGTVMGVEVGDTFTAPNYRKSGCCSTRLGEIFKFSDFLNENYLGVSVFGRLMYETLSQARDAGVHFAFGTPNNLSKPAYLKRFDFREALSTQLCSLYLLGEVGTENASTTSQVQKIYLNLVKKLIKTKQNVFKNISPEYWIAECLGGTSSAVHQKTLLLKDYEFYIHRYVKHPVNKYSFHKMELSKAPPIYFIVRHKSNGDKQVVEVVGDLNSIRLFKILVYCQELINKKQKVLMWYRLNKRARIALIVLGILVVPNVSIIIKDLTRNQSFPDFNYFGIGDSDNG